jgi:hypothetical protein
MMRLHCIAGRHQAARGEVRNQGFGFSRCRGCGCDMVRSRRAWRTVPAGFRVVWKGRGSSPVGGAQLLFDLPVVGRSLIPCVERRSRLWSLADLVATGLHYLVSAAAERLQAWIGSLVARRPVRLPVYRLPAAAANDA